MARMAFNIRTSPPPLHSLEGNADTLRWGHGLVEFHRWYHLSDDTINKIHRSPPPRPPNVGCGGRINE